MADESCPHLKNGCSIYESRPNVCRTWYCGWRYIDWLGESWRPDRSNVLLRLKDGNRFGLILQPLVSPQEVLTTLQSLELVGTCVENGLPVLISVPGKPGHCNAILEVNQRLEQALKSRNLADVQAAMLEAIESASQLQTIPVKPFHSVVLQRRLDPCACGSGKRFKHCHGR